MPLRDSLQPPSADRLIPAPCAAGPDRWTRRARPAFLYVMYVMILWSIPLGLIATVRPAAAEAMARSMAGYLGALPDALYALFGTGYLGYTAARQWGKANGTEL